MTSSYDCKGCDIDDGKRKECVLCEEPIVDSEYYPYCSRECYHKDLSEYRCAFCHQYIAFYYRYEIQWCGNGTTPFCSGKHCVDRYFMKARIKSGEVIKCQGCEKILSADSKEQESYEFDSFSEFIFCTEVCELLFKTPALTPPPLPS